jgi:hypothetical protein
MIAQYFIMKKTSQQIEFVSAVNKLKTDSEDKDKELKEKTKYSDRKKMGIQKCLELLNNDGSYVSWMDYFKTHAKKDDLADSFLQGLWYIKKV